MTILGLYRPPSLGTELQFVSEFLQFLEEILPSYSNLMILGDFNLHLDDGTSASTDFNNSLYSLGLEQHVTFPTQIEGNVLDLVISEVTNGINVLSCEQGPYISDHCVIKVITYVKRENIKSESVSFRNFKAIDKSKFANDLNEISLTENNVDGIVEEFEDQVQKNLDTHAPVKEITRVRRAPKPWFNEDILQFKRKSRKCERLWMKYKTPEHYQLFKQARNKYHFELKEEKRRTLSQTVLDLKGNSKLYKFVADITGTSADNPMPNGENDNTTAEKFADFFMDKISKIRESLQTFDQFEPQVKDIPSFDNFDELTENKVKQIIGNMQSKSCELDILPTKLLKQFLGELLPFITKLVNVSLMQGVFPSKWKKAIVRPLIKKIGLELTFSNYRQVSNLSFLS
ncbi:uncharacterized protein LOC128219177 [Mya arenaria]|uniref:uncharacterized protein LOC128219177 n=1 Tax=Mya arenaria TaxID=6604 RepID=UPI0022E97B71|nr:uncharacterized protein LOC128219177 [Mya arenaria]